MNGGGGEPQPCGIEGAHIGAMMLLAMSLIWFGYIARQFTVGREKVFYVAMMISTAPCGKSYFKAIVRTSSKIG
jgi:hypothetical protein